jgi:hypothetical protein
MVTQLRDVTVILAVNVFLTFKLDAVVRIKVLVTIGFQP